MKRKFIMSSDAGDGLVGEVEEICNHSNQIESSDNNKVDDSAVAVSPLKHLRDMTETASYRVLPKISSPDDDQSRVGRPIRRPSKCNPSDSDTARRRRSRPNSGSSGENIPPSPTSPSTEEENRKNANMTDNTPDIDGNANDESQRIIPVEPDTQTPLSRLSDVPSVVRKGSSPKRKSGGPANFEVLNPIKATNIRTGADRNSLPIPKPYIDVKLVKNDRRRTFASKSSENLLNDTESSNTLDRGDKKPFRQNISQYHSAEDVLNNDSPPGKDEEEKIYSLPEPYTYGDNTLKAVKQITEKYDTLQRRKMRARSFRENQRCHLFSTSSSEGARSPTRKAMSGSNPNLPVEIDGDIFLPGGVTQHDVARIELFYCSQNTEVIVCECLTDLCIGQVGISGEVQQWEPLQTGIPVFVLTKGLKRKTKRQLTVVVAERETGFPLWQDTINYLSKYKDTSPTFHTMFLSSDHKKVAGFQMYCVTAAMDFLSKFKDMTSDPEDELWSMSRSKGSKKKKKFKFPKFKVPDKKEISQPCNFNHVTKVEGPRDPRLHSSFSDLLDTDVPVSAEAPCSDDFRARAPTR